MVSSIRQRRSLACLSSIPARKVLREMNGVAWSLFQSLVKKKIDAPFHASPAQEPESICVSTNREMAARQIYV